MFLYLSSQWSVISAGWRCELKKDWASLRRATPHSDIRRMARYADREATVRWAVRQTGSGRQSGFGNANASVRNKRSEEHTAELQSLMRISYAVFCLNKKTVLNHCHSPMSTTDEQRRVTHLRHV